MSAVAKKQRGSAKQPRKQPSKGECRSPLTGAVIKLPNEHSFKPGHSGNPAGYSSKRRLERDLEEVLASGAHKRGVEMTRSRKIVEDIAEVASGEYRGEESSVAAFNAIARASGLFGNENNDGKVTVHTLLVFSERESGPVELEHVATDAVVEQEIARDDGSLELEA